jgi:hypothetical protein
MKRVRVRVRDGRGGEVRQWLKFLDDGFVEWRVGAMS